MKNEVFFIKIKCCNTDKKFYGRYDFAADDKWVLTYGKEYIDKSNINKIANSNATFDISNSRKGPQYKCPYCGNKGYVRCGQCGKLTCHNNSNSHFICSHCGYEGEVKGVVKTLNGLKGTAQ